MVFTVGTILDRHYNAAHADHIHVEPKSKKTGTPPKTNPGMTAGVKAIYEALNAEFGPGRYFLDSNGRYVGNDKGVGWTHMGGWNRRKIAGSTAWSQHAYWNALDIGPYYGKDQDKFVKFLKENTGKEIKTEDNDMAILTDKEQELLRAFLKELEDLGSHVNFVRWIIPDIRKGIVTVDELDKALKALGSNTTVDALARQLAKQANDRLDAMKEALK